VVQSEGVAAVDDPHRAMKAADAIVVLTEWPKFGTLDWTAVAEQAPDAVVVDTRNVADADAARRPGCSTSRTVGRAGTEGWPLHPGYDENTAA
jgi:UDPglucose 6-dehydrogenase